MLRRVNTDLTRGMSIDRLQLNISPLKPVICRGFRIWARAYECPNYHRESHTVTREQTTEFSAPGLWNDYGKRHGKIPESCGTPLLWTSSRVSNLCSITSQYAAQQHELTLTRHYENLISAMRLTFSPTSDVFFLSLSSTIELNML